MQQEATSSARAPVNHFAWPCCFVDAPSARCERSSPRTLSSLHGPAAQSAFLGEGTVNSGLAAFLSFATTSIRAV